MKPTPFAHFDRTLGAEHRARTEKDIEAGIVDAPKVRKSGGGRPRPSSRPNPDGKTTIELSVDPKFTAAAALTAARQGTTTKDVMEQWLTTLAYADQPKNPADRVVMFTLHLAVGPDAFPEDVFRDLCKAADMMGVSPSRLASGIVKEALAKRRDNTAAA
jgi:hypothetical protein